MIYKMIPVCSSRHRADATCHKTPEPPRCRGCKVDCSRYDRLMLSSIDCQSRKIQLEVSENE